MNDTAIATNLQRRSNPAQLIAIYACDASGCLLWFNPIAGELWGGAPRLADDAEPFGGSHRIYFDGRGVARDQTPMACVLQTGLAVQGAEAVVEQPNRSGVRAIIHIAVKDAQGRSWPPPVGFPR